MANLRANTIAGSGGSGNNIKASLYLDGSGEYLSFADNADWAMGTGDLTAECWFYVESNVDYRSIIDARAAAGGNGWMIGVKADGNVYVYSQAWLLITTGAEGTIKTWHHVAYVRKDGTHTLYLDGVSKATSTTSRDYTTQKFAVGTTPYSLGNEVFKGYISNVHLVKGTALYTSNFDPYQVSPKSGTNTVLLCCNDSQKPEAYEVSPVAITPGGTPTPSKFIPSNLAVPTGVVFNGDTKVNSQGYMYFPTGDTTQRGRGRGLNGGNAVPANTKTIDYFTIQTGGTSIDFGELTVAGQHTACSSTTRGVFAMGTLNNTIDYVTISTTANAIDFGDRTVAKNGPGGLSNNVRGVFAGGGAPNPQSDVIDYITIASTGNATDFGNMSTGNKNPTGLASPTRGVIAHGGDPMTNVIDYITIATTGNATDFGDTTNAAEGYLACASNIRGIFSGGYVSPANVNTIQYVTIATTGNATDFGDIGSNRVTPQSGAGTSNNLRGVTMGGRGYAPSSQNTISKTMEYVNIATTGNSFDFGYLAHSRVYCGSCSDSHGGL